MELDYPYEIRMVVANNIGTHDEPLHGDIYQYLWDLAKEHPNCEPIFGFCIANRRTSIVPDGFDDWYDTPEEAYGAYGLAKAQGQI